MSSCIDPHMRQSLAGHVLEQVLDTEAFKAFKLRKPGDGRMMSTLITFTPEGIVIQGDLTPETNGTVSCYGYGLKWFSGRLSEDYLCGKFLQMKFVPEFVEPGFKRDIISKRRDGELTKDGARELWDSIRWMGEITPENVYRFWADELGHEDGEGCPGYGYEPGEAGWLCAIQQRFAELRREALGEVEA